MRYEFESSSSCIICEADVIQVKYHGKETLMDDNAVIHYTLNTKTRVLETVPTLRFHKCRKMDIMAHAQRIELLLVKTEPERTYIWYGYPLDVFKPFAVPCPKCGAKKGDRCIDQRAYKNGANTKHPHTERSFAGLKAQGKERKYDTRYRCHYVQDIQPKGGHPREH